MRLVEIWRHPIKAHGREDMSAFEIEAGGTIPLDREWAVAHEAAKLNGESWVPCANFSRGAKTSALMAIKARTGDGVITVSHPDLADLTFDPDCDNRIFLEWIAPLVDPSRAAPTGIVRAADRGFTDTEFPSISLLGMASHRAVEQKVGRPLSHLRWRGNLWIDGLAPWEEFDMIGRELTLGTARFAVEERITRCRATMANPETGKIDIDTLGALEDGWGHRDFGVYLSCVAPGHVAVGDVLVLS